MAIGSRCGRDSSSRRSLKSDGPSISTAAGRSRAISSRTTRAAVGLWCRTGKKIDPPVASEKMSGGRFHRRIRRRWLSRLVERLPRAARAALHDVVEVVPQLLQVVGRVLEGRADEVLDQVLGLARSPPP